MSEALELLISEISGLKPKAYLILGQGFVREEWKSLCFSHGKSVTKEAIQTLNQFAQSAVPECVGRILDRSARVELLRQSFKDENLKKALPTLFSHHFRPKFYDSLDRALQKGRLLFAHAAEAKVLEERLVERLGLEPRREEFFLLNRFWETLLEARNFFDEASLLELAEERVRLGIFKLPVDKFYRAEHFQDPPRIQFLWQTIASASNSKTPVQTVVPTGVHTILSQSFRKKTAPFLVQRKLAHSLEDSLQFLFDDILSNGELSSHAVVIEDRPEIRRSVKRLAHERGIALLDARDPTLLMTAEEIKSALLPLEIVARNYPSELILPWLQGRFANSGELRKKIIDYGNVSALQNYQRMPELYEQLVILKTRFPSRLSFAEMEIALFANLKESKFPAWVSQTFEKVFQAWKVSLTQLDRVQQKRPLRILLDELKEKLRSTPPVVGPERNLFGLKLYRVDQAASLELRTENEAKVHFFGVSQAFFEPRENTSEWFSVRDIEILANEFGLAGRKQLAELAKSSFVTWASQSKNAASLWEFIYDETGSETESIELTLKSISEIELLPDQKLPVHPRVLPSFVSKLKLPQAFQSAPLARTEFPMSFLNALGNCAFTAYAQHLLKLYDERDPDFDLSGDSFGNLVHSAVEALVASNLTLPVDEAFQKAWKETAKPAWIRSDRLFQAIRMKTISILESFLASEKIYREQSHAKLIGQEVPIELKRDGLVFKGRLDRIDQHADGIVLFDYKTNSVLPNGGLTRETGKGLQLPAYVLALKDQHAQEVVGAQYVQLLAKETPRNSGFLFAKWNKGKKADVVEFPLSTARSNSKSLMADEPADVWREMDAKIGSLIMRAKLGNFDPKPADPKDCKLCRYRLLCGKPRNDSEVVEGDDT
jgi:hypothetical protein